MNHTTIDPKTLADAHDREPSGAQIVDVRTPSEFEAAHIAGSKLAPLDALDPDHVKSAFRNEEPVYVVCKSGNRAKQAIEKLQAAGCENAVLVEGGITAWEQHDLPLNRGRETMSLERQVRIAAGLLIFAGTLLALLNPWFLIIPGFVGAGLAFAGITDSCAMGMLIAKAPWNRRGSAAAECSICAKPRENAA